MHYSFTRAEVLRIRLEFRRRRVGGLWQSSGYRDIYGRAHRDRRLAGTPEQSLMIALIVIPAAVPLLLLACVVPLAHPAGTSMPHTAPDDAAAGELLLDQPVDL